MTGQLGGQRHLPAHIDLDDVETAKQAAERLGVAEVTIWQWVRRGHLQPLNVGVRPLFFHAPDVDECAAQRLDLRSDAVTRRANLRRAQEIFARGV